MDLKKKLFIIIIRWTSLEDGEYAFSYLSCNCYLKFSFNLIPGKEIARYGNFHMLYWGN